MLCRNKCALNAAVLVSSANAVQRVTPEFLTNSIARTCSHTHIHTRTYTHARARTANAFNRSVGVMSVTIRPDQQIRYHQQSNQLTKKQKGNPSTLRFREVGKADFVVITVVTVIDVIIVVINNDLLDPVQPRLSISILTNLPAIKIFHTFVYLE